MNQMAIMADIKVPSMMIVDKTNKVKTEIG